MAAAKLDCLAENATPEALNAGIVNLLHMTTDAMPQPQHIERAVAVVDVPLDDALATHCRERRPQVLGLAL